MRLEACRRMLIVSPSQHRAFTAQTDTYCTIQALTSWRVACATSSKAVRCSAPELPNQAVGSSEPSFCVMRHHQGLREPLRSQHMRSLWPEIQIGLYKTRQDNGAWYCVILWCGRLSGDSPRLCTRSFGLLVRAEYPLVKRRVPVTSVASAHQDGSAPRTRHRIAVCFFCSV